MKEERSVFYSKKFDITPEQAKEFDRIAEHNTKCLEEMGIIEKRKDLVDKLD